MPTQIFLNIIKRGNTVLKKLYDLVYPQYCLHCNSRIGKEIDDVFTATYIRGPVAATRGGLCGDCVAKIRRLGDNACSLCHIPFTSDAATLHTPDHRCSDCRLHQPSFSKAITPFYYEGPLATAIQKFKYNKQTYLSDFFVGLISNDLSLEVDLVVAIPLHPNRLRSREFNQSLLLAKKIAGVIACPYSIDALMRRRETVPQVGLSRKEREENVKEAFFVSRPNDVKDQRILLVDDVYTTGTTLKEGAKALIDAGAKEVIVTAIGRMPSPY